MKKIQFRKTLVVLIVMLTLLLSSIPVVAADTADDFNYCLSADGNVEIVGYEGTDSTVVIPSVIDEKTVTAIGKFAFGSNKSIVKVVLNEGITKIGDNAFDNCTALQTVVLPQTLLEIGASAFSNCTSLSEISLPTNLRVLGTAAFVNNQSLKQIVLPSSLETVGNSAFNSSGLENVVVQEGVPYISITMFCNCVYLKSVALPASVRGIGKSAFSNCDAMTTVELNEGMRVIGEEAFLHCDELSQIDLPSTLTDISSRAFYGCQKLGKIRIKSRNVHIRSNAFRGTAYFDNKSNWKNNILYIDGCLIFAHFEDSSYTVAPETYVLAEYALLNCNNLKTLTLPASVSLIGRAAVAMDDVLDTVHFQGSREQWNRIKMYDENESVQNALLIFDNGNSDHKHIEGEWEVESTASANKDGCKIVRCTKCSVVLKQKTLHRYTYASMLFFDCERTDWYVKNGAILYVYENELFKGTGNNRFSPESPMERGMFVTVLGRMHGVKVKRNVATEFADVKENEYYTGYVKWAAENGIVNGVAKGRFAPNDIVTREQICTMLIRYCDYAAIKPNNVNAAVNFSDADEISGYARSSVKKCQRAGIINGEKSENSYRFRPQDSATRAEVATIFMNFCKEYK